MAEELLYEELVLNLRARPKKQQMEGRDYLVVPTVMIREGVWTGNNGPVLYRENTLAKYAPNWNHKPFVVNHPEIDGKPVEAITPEVLDKYKIGLLLGTTVNSKRQNTKVWVEEARVKEVEPSLYEDILNGRPVNVSTGQKLGVNKKGGEFGGKKFVYEAVEIFPDHLAALPGRDGACSVGDGAGMFVNEAGKTDIYEVLNRQIETGGESGKLAEQMLEMLVANELPFSRTQLLLSQALATKFGKPGQYWNGYVVDTFKDYVVYRLNGATYKIGYTGNDTGVALKGEPKEVAQVVSYEEPTSNVDVVNNNAPVPQVEKEKMDKAQKVTGLITNSGGAWTEGDRPYLEGLSDTRLDKFISDAQKANTPPPTPVTTNNQAPTPTPAPTGIINNGTQQTGQQPVQLTVEQFLKAAPPEVALVLNQGLDALNHERTTLVNNIKSTPGNKFSDTFLNDPKTPIDFLRGVAAIADTAKKQATGSGILVNNGDQDVIPVPSMMDGMNGGYYFGAAGGPMTNNNAMSDEDPPITDALEFTTNGVEVKPVVIKK